MRALISEFQLRTPSSLSEVLALLGSDPGTWLPFAGGTDLMVLLEAGKLSHKKYVNLWPLAELRTFDITSDQVTLGALTTYSAIRANKVLRDEFPMLCQAAAETGGPAIQNRGTLGGNIINASPAADSPPALLAYDAQIELISTHGSRWLPYYGFHTDYKHMRINPGELLSNIRLPRRMAPVFHYYRKVGTRKAQAISKVCFAATGLMENGRVAHMRIAIGSVAPIVVRCIETEKLLLGTPLDANTIRSARKFLLREISPIDDIRSTANYRQQIAGNMLEDFLQRLQASE